jgi:hypothetical protein
MSDGDVTRRLAAILAADVAGYTRMMESDEAATLEAWWSARRECPSSKHSGLLSLFFTGGSGSSWFDVNRYFPDSIRIVANRRRTRPPMEGILLCGHSAAPI